MKKLQRRGKAIVLLVAISISMQGCVAMVAGTTVAGAIAANDRRSVGAQTEDKVITTKALGVAGSFAPRSHVTATAYNRKLLITGEAVDQTEKNAIEAKLKAIAGVESVVNEMEIGGSSSYTSRGNDALLTAKVVARLIESKEIKAGFIKVTTAHGVVYLMGKVSREEGDAAAKVAQGVSGALKIVKIFEYV